MKKFLILRGELLMNFVPFFTFLFSVSFSFCFAGLSMNIQFCWGGVGLEGGGVWNFVIEQ